MNKLKINASFCILLMGIIFHSCKKCTECSMIQDGVTVYSTGDYCKEEKTTQDFKKRLEQNNDLLDYANAKVVCSEIN